MNINVMTDIIPSEHQNIIEERFLGGDFPLFLNSKSVHLDNKTAFWDKNTKESNRLIHCFVVEGRLISNDWKLVDPLALAIVNAIGLPPKIASCKLNINYPVIDFSESNYYPPHLDTPDKGIIGIYYVNDSDGDTLFFDDDMKDGAFNIIETCTPKKGTVVTFPSSLLHANKPPRITPARCVINFNFLFDT